MAPADEALAPVKLLLVFLNMPWSFCERTSSLNAALFWDRVWTITDTRKFNIQMNSRPLQQRQCLPQPAECALP